MDRRLPRSIGRRWSTRRPPSSWNDASVRFHTGTGFTPVGVFHEIRYKHGAWRDVAWFERRITTHAGAPAAPISLPAVTRSAAFSEALRAGDAMIRALRS
jgi:hypothetical protein